jgi:beta-glucosidase
MNNKFPTGFLWGVAASSYQIEGNNANSDWWEWEKAGKADDQSGIACDYWNRYKSDHDLIQELGVKVFRSSIEWSRIEPEEGVFSQEAIQHYREIFQDLKNRGIKTQITLWWWTSPIWFQKNYGFQNKKSVAIFSRYAETVARELGDLIDIYTILNEPMVPLGQGFLAGAFPPGYVNPFKFWRAVNNLAKAYIESYKKIHAIKSDAQVGISYLYNWYESNNWLLKILNRILKWYRIDLLGNKIKDYQDYFGLNYYRLGKIEFNWRNIRLDSKNQIYFGFTVVTNKHNIMNWVAYPEGMEKAIKQAYEKYKVPIFITENGVPTDKGLDDNERIDFINNHLKFIKKVIDDGVEVQGYNFWSLFDNLEWLYGYKPRFGLIEIDYKTLERKPRKSFYIYKEIIENNGIKG